MTPEEVVDWAGAAFIVIVVLIAFLCAIGVAIAVWRMWQDTRKRRQ